MQAGNSFGNAIGATAGGICPMSAAVSISMVCTGSDVAPDTSSMTCETTGSNPMATHQMVMQLQMAMCTLQCKKAKIQAVHGEVNCLTAQANMLTQQAGSLTGLYSNNIQNMQKYISNIELMDKDREVQIEDLNDRLNTNRKTGAPGLLELQQKTQEMLSAMPGEIQKERKDYQQQVLAERSLDEQIQVRQMSLTMDCFNNRSVDSYKCAINGPPVSPSEYLLCRFQQGQTLGSNGRVEQNATQTAQAQSKTAGLKSLLGQITGDTSSVSKIPTNQNESDASIQAPLNVLSIADIDRIYGSRLAAYKIGGTDAEQFLLSTIKNCNSRAINQVNLESSRANTTIGKAKSVLKIQQQSIESDIQVLFNKYGQQFSKISSGLTNQSSSLNLSRCSQNNTAIKINCLDDIKNKMGNLLNGSVNNSINIQIKGNSPSSIRNLTCNGLNGCVTSLQKEVKQISFERQELSNIKKQNTLAFNQSVETFTKEVASQLSAQSQMISDRINTLNTALASLGQGSGFKMTPMKGEPLEYDAQTGLVKPPKNVLNLVGQYVNPPLPDLSGIMSGGMGGLASAESSLDQKYGQLSSSLVQISNLEASCASQKNNQLIKNIVDLGSAAQNCHFSPYCTQDKVTELQTALAKITNHPGLGGGSAASLNTGATSMCDSPGLAQPVEPTTLKPVLPTRPRPTVAQKTAHDNAVAAWEAERKDYRDEKRTYDQAIADYKVGARGCGAYFSTVLSASKMLQTSKGASGLQGSAGGAWGF